MCLMLYLGTPRPLPPVASPDLTIEPVGAGRDTVRQWFTHPFVQFVGAHTGCSCGFPSVMAEGPVEDFEGMRLESDSRDADLRSVAALLRLLTSVVEAQGVELYPVADGDEGVPPKGTISWRLSDLRADRLFFNERFLHVVSA